MEGFHATTTQQLMRTLHTCIMYAVKQHYIVLCCSVMAFCLIVLYIYVDFPDGRIRITTYINTTQHI